MASTRVPTGAAGSSARPAIDAPSALDLPQTVDGLLDAISGVERTIASLTASRARLVDLAHRAVLQAERARSAERSAHAVAEQARRVLAAELAALLRIPGGSAAQLVGESQALSRRLPATLEALAEGQISYPHAITMVDNANSLPDEAVGDYERAVLLDARRLNPARFRDRARRLRELHHPESLSARRAAQHDRRNVSIEPARDGMAWLGLYGPAEQIVAIDDRLDRIAASMRSADDPRTFAQLKADAFCRLLLDGAVPGSGHSGIRPQVLIAVPALTLLKLDDEPATLEGYGPIPADVARQLAAHAPSFVRLLTHPETGTVLSVGRDRYTIPADMRMFLRLRDETCRGVGCGRRAATSDVDHGHEWADGGTTSIDNLAHLCRGDHTRKTALGWKVKHLPDGVLRWTTPFGRTYRTQPSAVIRT
jgi:hypothetical protein